MIGSFMFIVYLGHVPMMFLVFTLQVMPAAADEKQGSALDRSNSRQGMAQ
jgi:hypothetical protein